MTGTKLSTFDIKHGVGEGKCSCITSFFIFNFLGYSTTHKMGILKTIPNNYIIKILSIPTSTSL